jgi:DNA-binding Lrp family transcriptional regulator
MTTVVGPHPPTDTPVLDVADRRAVQLLQADLPLVPEPFDADLLSRAQALLERGVMRRFAAVLYHRRAGYSANVLGVWAVPAEQVETVGSQIAAFRAVSHCYQRPIYPDWPYSVFSMIHGRSREECNAVLGAISSETRVDDYAALWSLREFKKVRLRYFTPDHAEWERRIMAEAYAGVNAR